MSWDIPLWLGVVLAFGDACIALMVGLKYGPLKAKKLITTDEEYVESRNTLKKVDEELPRMRHDLEAHKSFLEDKVDGIIGRLDHKLDIFETRVDATNAKAAAQVDLLSNKMDRMRIPSASDMTAGAERAVEKGVAQLKDKVELELSRLSIPDAEIQKVTRSLKQAVQMQMKDIDILNDMQDILDDMYTRVEKLLGEKEVDIDAALVDDALGDPEMTESIVEFLVERGAPERMTRVAITKGISFGRKYIQDKGLMDEFVGALMT